MEFINKRIESFEKLVTTRRREFLVFFTAKLLNIPKQETIDALDRLTRERDEIRDKIVKSTDEEERKELTTEMNEINAKYFPVKGEYDLGVETVEAIRKQIDLKRDELTRLRQELSDLKEVKEFALRQIEAKPELKSKEIIEILQAE